MGHKDNSEMVMLFFLIFCLLVIWVYKKLDFIIYYIIFHKEHFGIIFSILATGVYFLTKRKIKILYNEFNENKILETDKDDSFYIGQSIDGKSIYLPESARVRHTQIVGTTSAGKTESVIIPWAIRDIKKNRGFIIIDGKSDRSLLDKLYAYCVENKRAKDFRLFSLVNIAESYTYNPLSDGEPEEIAERVFSSFTMENEYYKAVQFEIFKHALMIFDSVKEVPSFIKLSQAISEPEILLNMAEKGKDPLLIEWAMRFKNLSKESLIERTSGLLNQMGFFTSGKTAKLFNSENFSISIEEAMAEGLILYFQLPAMKSPTLGKATGKMLLQNIQSAVASRHNSKDKDFPLFSVFLDDFTEYLTPSFVTLLNKSRSANVGVVFAHQALGDLAVLGEAIKNTILTNANLKIFMRTNESESAEYFAKSCGTKGSFKLTERQTKTTFGSEKTGEGSVREVEEFIFHPNIFKRDLSIGEAIMVVPLNKRTQTARLKLDKLDDLPEVKIPIIPKEELSILRIKSRKTHVNGKRHDELLQAISQEQVL
ncbi:MAG: TraM recognition domain-containing protein [Bdellovibrionales bacterium]|nr:TraM recognition domain-containing protein [Bdellovibrionales bacterium]